MTRRHGHCCKSANLRTTKCTTCKAKAAGLETSSWHGKRADKSMRGGDQRYGQPLVTLQASTGQKGFAPVTVVRVPNAHPVCGITRWEGERAATRVFSDTRK